jgi:hypothetical protein
LPEPDVGVLNVIHDTGFCVVQEHAGPALTAMVPLPPLAATDAIVGEMLKPQPPSWVTLTA